MDTRINPTPEGYHSVTPSLTIRGAKEAIEYYKKAFGAELLARHDRPDGKVMHAAIKIGDSIIMFADECGPHEGHENCSRSPDDLKGTTGSLYIYTDDVDKVFDRAIEAGGHALMEVDDAFWGDRMGMLKDPFGHIWMVATHKEDVSPEQLEKRAEEFFSHQKQPA
jgi:PhnB protein